MALKPQIAEGCALLGVVLIAGSAFLVSDIAKDSFPPLSQTCGRLVLGSLALGVATVATQGRAATLQVVQRLALAEWVLLLLAGLANTAIPYTLFAVALGVGIGASTASAFAGATPVLAATILCAGGCRHSYWAAKYSSISDGGNCGKIRLGGGLFAGFAGVLAVALSRKASGKTTWGGIVLQLGGVASKALAAVLAQSFNQVQADRGSAPLPVLTQAFLQASAGAIVALVLALTLDCAGRTPSLLDPKHLTTNASSCSFLDHVPASGWASLLVLALFCSCLVYVFQFFLVKRVGAIRETVSDQLALTIGVLEGAVFRNEWADLPAWDIAVFCFGAILVVAGATLVFPSDAEQKQEQTLTSTTTPDESRLLF